MWRHGVLQQNAVHIRIGIEVVNFGQQLLSRSFLRQNHFLRLHTDAFTGIAFHAHIGGGSRIIADQNRRQDGLFAASSGRQLSNALTQICFDFLGNSLAIEDDTCHCLASLLLLIGMFIVKSHFAVFFNPVFNQLPRLDLF